MAPAWRPHPDCCFAQYGFCPRGLQWGGPHAPSATALWCRRQHETANRAARRVPALDRSACGAPRALGPLLLLSTRVPLCRPHRAAMSKCRAESRPLLGCLECLSYSEAASTCVELGHRTGWLIARYHPSHCPYCCCCDSRKSGAAVVSCTCSIQVQVWHHCRYSTLVALTNELS